MFEWKASCFLRTTVSSSTEEGYGGNKSCIIILMETHTRMLLIEVGAVDVTYSVLNWLASLAIERTHKPNVNIIQLYKKNFSCPAWRRLVNTTFSNFSKYLYLIHILLSFISHFHSFFFFIYLCIFCHIMYYIIYFSSYLNKIEVKMNKKLNIIWLLRVAGVLENIVSYRWAVKLEILYGYTRP